MKRLIFIGVFLFFIIGCNGMNHNHEHEHGKCGCFCNEDEGCLCVCMPECKCENPDEDCGGCNRCGAQ